MEKYIDALNAPMEVPEWDRIYDEAVSDGIPVIRKTTAKIVYFLLKLRRSKKVLEIGTGSGYSTLWVNLAIAPDGELITLERDRKRFVRSREVLKNIPLVQVLYTDAFDYLKDTAETFDAVLLDSQKRDYIDIVPLLENHLSPGALLLVDNILFGGRVLGMDPADEEKYRGGTELIKEFNSYISAGGKFETLFLPLEDGIAAAIKK